MSVVALRPRLYHRADKIAPNDDVSALCSKTPKPINLGRASWTIQDEAARGNNAAKVQRNTARVRPSLPRGQRLRETEDGPDKLCARCDEWWPATPEFFFRNRIAEGGLAYCCKACFAEWRLTHPRRKASS